MSRVLSRLWMSTVGLTACVTSTSVPRADAAAGPRDDRAEANEAAPDERPYNIGSSPSPKLPQDLVSRDNYCRPGHCLRWEWKLKRLSNVEMLGTQVDKWAPREKWNEARLLALPQELSPEQAKVWLEENLGALVPGQIWRKVELESDLEDGYTLRGRVGSPGARYEFGWGQASGVTLRVFDGVQVACTPSKWTSHEGLHEANAFCTNGYGTDGQVEYSLTEHSWRSKSLDWSLPPREGIAAHATFLRGDAEGHGRTQVQLIDPTAPVDANRWREELAEAGFLNSGYVWTDIRVVREGDDGFVIEGDQVLVGARSSKPEPSFVVVRRVGGWWVVCHPITLERPDHFELARTFCLDGFSVAPGTPPPAR